MSIFRLGVVLVVAVALLPSDPNARSELALKAAHVGQETATFCERNPHTCGAGQELWAAFVQKAQYGLTLAAEFARNYADRSRTEAQPSAPASYGEPLSPASAPAQSRPQPPVPAVPRYRPVWHQPAQPRERI